MTGSMSRTSCRKHVRFDPCTKYCPYTTTLVQSMNCTSQKPYPGMVEIDGVCPVDTKQSGGRYPISQIHLPEIKLQNKCETQKSHSLNTAWLVSLVTSLYCSSDWDREIKNTMQYNVGGNFGLKYCSKYWLRVNKAEMCFIGCEYAKVLLTFYALSLHIAAVDTDGAFDLVRHVIWNGVVPLDFFQALFVEGAFSRLRPLVLSCDLQMIRLKIQHNLKFTVTIWKIFFVMGCSYITKSRPIF